MQFYLVGLASIIRQNESAFTYHSSQTLDIGTLVRVSVGKRFVNGVVLERVGQKPSFKTKPIEVVIEPDPLPTPLIRLAEWMSDYYASHLATTLQTILPAGLHKIRRKAHITPNAVARDRTNIMLNPDQEKALAQIAKAKGSILLHGITGSGKTQVYIEAAKRAAAQGRSSIILVPEIALTPQLLAEFANHFQNLVVTHSHMSEAERHNAWLFALRNTNLPMVVIGPRSALFMPVRSLGLIVIDECHEPSYKQEQSPKYLALRAATMLARFHGNTKVVFGSATPAITDFYIAAHAKQPIIELPRTITATSSNIQLISCVARDNFGRHRFLSDALLSSIEEALASRNQILLFHNRRGTAPTTLCQQCGWIAECPKCFLPLTLHSDSHILRCHICAYQQSVPPSCPICLEPAIIFKGIGTKLIESEVHKLFPKATIARFDADNSEAEAMHNRYQSLYSGEIDIMIGTQMLVKGLDLPKLTVVGVVQADSGLMLPDYTAEERVFQLLYQVIGRVGRRLQAGKVIIQTYQPDHPALRAAVNRDYPLFYKNELLRRAGGHFPPFSYLLKLTCIYKTEPAAVRASKKMAQLLRQPGLEVLGPTPAFHERQAGGFKWQIIVKSSRRSRLVAIARTLPANWQANLDPVTLL